MKNVSIKIDGVMLLVLAVLAGAVWLYFKGDKIKEVATVGLNPANQNNYINQAAQKVVGKDRLQNIFDHIFAAGDILTPWNGVSPYAKETWGIDQ